MIHRNIDKLCDVLRWMVEDGKNFEHVYDPDEAELIFYSGSELAHPKHLPVEVARIMVEEGWSYEHDEENNEHSYRYSL